MNNIILVSVKKINKIYLTKKLIFNNIFYYDLKEYKNYITFKTNKDNIKVIKRYFDKKNIRIVRYFGIDGFIKFIKKHYLFLICLIWGYILLTLLSNIIFDIEIVSTNDEMVKHLLKELEYNGIKKYKFKKSFNKISKIKEKILEENKDVLEWMEIESHGTKYIVEFTPRIIINPNKLENTPTNITASKDALIMHIEAKQGEILKDLDDYVKKGEVIISGNIMRNDTIVNQVKAIGKVYGEVWYTVNVTVPYNYVEYIPTGEVINHYYIDLFGLKMTLTGRYNTKFSMNKKEVILDKPYLFFDIIKERKEIFEYKEFNITYKEAYEEALKRADKSINVKLSKDEYIIDKKVLKIEEFSSKINIEIFYKVYEDITNVSIIE